MRATLLDKAYERSSIFLAEHDERESTVSPGPLTEDDPLEDFDTRQFTYDGVTKTVYTAGAGPAVIVMTEMPGISRPGRPIRALGPRRRVHRVDAESVRCDGTAAVDRQFRRLVVKGCISAEFRAFASNASSPVTQWFGRWRARPIRCVAARVSGRSACASPATSHCR